MVSRGLRDSARFPGKKKKWRGVGGEESGSCLLYVKQVGELIPHVTPIQIERPFPRGGRAELAARRGHGPAGAARAHWRAGGRPRGATTVALGWCLPGFASTCWSGQHRHPHISIHPRPCAAWRGWVTGMSAESQAGYPSVVMEPIHVSVCCCLFW